ARPVDGRAAPLPHDSSHARSQRRQTLRDGDEEGHPGVENSRRRRNPTTLEVDREPATPVRQMVPVAACGFAGRLTMIRQLLPLFFLLTPLPAAAAEFEFKDGDRVVLIGSTLIEREQRYGYWEAALTAANPDKNITFRNLGWSGDTVWGEARAGFGTAAD